MNLFALKPHPYSQFLPSSHHDDYGNLVASLRKTRRLRYSIIVYQNQILDGNQRLRACKEAKVEARHIEFKGTDEEALDLVWDLNFARRHMSASEKAAAVAKATLAFEQGQRTDLSASGRVTDKLARKAGVSRSTVYDAKKVLRDGTKEEKKSLESGTAKAKPLASKIRDREKLEANGQVVDDMGYLVPKTALAYWNRKPEAKNVLGQISAARGQVKKLLEDDPMWAGVSLNGVIADLSSAFNRFAAAVPAYVCPYCDGVKPDDCRCCKGKGVISKYFWNLVPEELRNARELCTKGTK